MKQNTFLFTVLASLSLAAPAPSLDLQESYFPAAAAWDEAGTTEYTIHHSCNSTEVARLRQALDETMALASHARDHILRYGNTSQIYTKYFGNAPTAEPAGWLNKLINGDKTGVLFRCDDIDGNCEQPGWAGHWRGSNATLETVICPLSYTDRWPLTALCQFGYTVANYKTNVYFASDLIHRLFHVPKIGEDIVEHYADTYTECLELAETEPEEAVRNTDSLQFFALEAFAFDIAVPGMGCTGTPSSSAVSSATAPSPTVTMISSMSSSAATLTSSAATCHTHSHGIVHCN